MFRVEAFLVGAMILGVLVFGEPVDQSAAYMTCQKTMSLSECAHILR